MRTLIMAAGLAAFPFSSLAESDSALDDRIKILESQLKILTQELESLKSATKNTTAITAPPPSEVKLSLEPGLKVKSVDNSTRFALGGRIQLDDGYVTNDHDGLGKAVNVRRLWLNTYGTIDHNWRYKAQLAAENQNLGIIDAFVAYDGFENLLLIAGTHKEFNTIEVQSSNLDTVFMERPAVTTAFRPIQNTGVSGTIYDDQWALKLGVFGDGPGEGNTDNEGHSYVARGIIAPIKQPDQTLHLGAVIRYKITDAGVNQARFRGRGESNVIETLLVDTGVIASVDNTLHYAADAMYQKGPFAVQGEYHRIKLNRSSASKLSFDGGYFQASYFLTGDQRGYSVKDGAYTGVKVLNPFNLSNGGSGAWEIGARYSYLNLNDADITGGALDSYSLALSWYPLDRLRFSMNYIINKTDDNAAIPDSNPHYLMFRSQVGF